MTPVEMSERTPQFGMSLTDYSYVNNQNRNLFLIQAASSNTNILINNINIYCGLCYKHVTILNYATSIIIHDKSSVACGLYYRHDYDHN